MATGWPAAAARNTTIGQSWMSAPAVTEAIADPAGEHAAYSVLDLLVPWFSQRPSDNRAAGLHGDRVERRPLFQAQGPGVVTVMFR